MTHKLIYSLFLFMLSTACWSQTKKYEVKYWEGTKNKKEEGSLVNGKREGKWTEYYKNGNKKTEVVFVNNTVEGKWTEWHENGKKKATGSSKNGVEHGLITEWYENGNKKSEISYFNGKKEYEGRNTYWYENGNLSIVELFKSGKREGEWLAYYLNGKLAGKSIFKDDKQISIEAWDENGNSIPVK